MTGVLAPGNSIATVSKYSVVYVKASTFTTPIIDKYPSKAPQWCPLLYPSAASPCPSWSTFPNRKPGTRIPGPLSCFGLFVWQNRFSYSPFETDARSPLANHPVQLSLRGVATPNANFVDIAPPNGRFATRCSRSLPSEEKFRFCSYSLPARRARPLDCCC